MKNRSQPFLAGLLFVVLLFGSWTAVSAAPELTMPETVFDFGICPQNSSVNHRFWLYSTGDDTLKILKVIPGCGCTRAPLGKDVLPAGDSTQIEIIFHTKHYKGRLTKRPRLKTNVGPNVKYIRFISEVTARPDSTYPIRIEPYMLDIDQYSEDTVDRMEIEIHNVSDVELHPTLVWAPSDLITVELPASIEAHSSGTGTVIINEDVLMEPFESSFTIKVDDETGTRFTVPVRRTVKIPGSGPNNSSVVR